MKIYEGTLQAGGLNIAVVLSRFNAFLSDRLLEGALDALRKMGADDGNLAVYKVPGSFEVPVVVKKIVSRKDKNDKPVDGVICLGALIRGDTPHFDYISAEVTKGLAQISLDTGIPVAYGILTVDTIEQGIERAGTKAGNKGHDAALALVETLTLLKKAGLD
ncbi:MAG: 6,7-dimethyl-8-ribityllumazine synthase [Acidobacteriota bacterium]|nr:6,7-dimethyl-8-ribityllumazine synthase [Acidobacteriota bacterium]